MALSNSPSAFWRTAALDVPAYILPANSKLKDRKLYVAFNKALPDDRWVCDTYLFTALGKTQTCANVHAKKADTPRLNIKTPVISKRASIKGSDTKLLNYIPLEDACSEARGFNETNFALWLHQAVLKMEVPSEPVDLFADVDMKPIHPVSDQAQTVFDVLSGDEQFVDMLLDTDDFYMLYPEMYEYMLLSGDWLPLVHMVQCTLRDDRSLFTLNESDGSMAPTLIASSMFDMLNVDCSWLPAIKPGKEADAKEFILNYFNSAVK